MDATGIGHVTLAAPERRMPDALAFSPSREVVQSIRGNI